ncbi:MAG: mechanosensitive ion channel family protein [Gemmatimonadota bacterium]
MWQALSQRLEEGIGQIYLFLPRLLAAIGILMAGFAIAKMVERATDLALHKIGFDRWMSEGGVTEALERAGTRLDPSSVLAKLVFWTVMLLVILLAADALGVQAVNTLFAELVAYIPNVIAAVIVLVLGILIGEFVKDLVLASAGGLPGGPTLGRAAKAAIILLAVFMALEQLDIAQDIVLVFFIAVVGAGALAAGIAFGLGGREIAAEVSRQWYDRMRQANDAVRERHEHASATHGQLTPPSPPADIGNPPPNEIRE